MVTLFHELDDGLHIGGKFSFPSDGRLLVDGKDAVGLFHAHILEHPQETCGGDMRPLYEGELFMFSRRLPAHPAQQS